MTMMTVMVMMMLVMMPENLWINGRLSQSCLIAVKYRSVPHTKFTSAAAFYKFAFNSRYTHISTYHISSSNHHNLTIFSSSTLLSSPAKDGHNNLHLLLSQLLQVDLLLHVSKQKLLAKFSRSRSIGGKRFGYGIDSGSTLSGFSMASSNSIWL